MKKLIVVGASAVGVVSMALFGAGVAAADDYAGEAYPQAASEVRAHGQTPVIAARTGTTPDYECVVSQSHDLGARVDLN